jgi:hypothetical protein
MASLFRLIALPAMLAVGGSALAGGALTFSTFGAQDMEHPDGLSLRQASPGRPGAATGFFLWYAASRGHRGGGLRGGK